MPQKTLKGYIAYIDGKPVGVVGIAKEADYGKFFTDFKPELEPYIGSITVWRTIKKAMRLVESYKGPVGAIAQSVEGCRNLHRLGFTHIHGGFYGWLN